LPCQLSLKGELECKSLNSVNKPRPLGRGGAEGGGEGYAHEIEKQERR